MLEREVAIKTITAEFCGDEDRLARLEREAKVLASLNHPNIAGIRGLEKADGVSYLELELVEGETLSAVLDAGPLSIDEALKIARQITEALEAAHGKGIVHRDLKPGNVMLRPDGTVKVLDFGLAKTTVAGGGAASGPQQPTASLTKEGVVVGTPAYMSPEQVRGRPVDTQTDIWAFGCLLFEMLTGWSPFGGPSQVETVGRILERDPDLNALPDRTPHLIRRLIRRCLEKEPRDRLHHISDARIEIREASDESPDAAAINAAVQAPGTGVPKAVWPAAIAACLAVIAVMGWLLLDRPDTSGPTQAAAIFAAGPPVPAPVTVVGSRLVAVSPDGSRLAYESDGSVWLQTLGRSDAERIAEGGRPFFSDDGLWVGYFVGSSLSIVSVADGATLALTENISSGRITGGSWRGDTIVFATQAGLYSISATSELQEPTLIIAAPPGQTFGWPQLLPDNDTALLTILSGSSVADSHIALVDLQTREVSAPLVRGAVGAKFASSDDGQEVGHILYANSEDRLVAREFNAVTREVGTVASEIPDVAVQVAGTYLAPAFDISGTGTLVHIRPRESGDLGLVWIDRDGNESALPYSIPGAPTYMRVSPDGSRLAMTIGLGTTGRRIWVMDLDRGVPVQLSDRTVGGAIYEEFESIWTRDSERIYFTSLRSGAMRIWSHAATGSGEDQMLIDDPELMVPMARADEDRLFVMRFIGNSSDIGVLDPDNPTAVEWLTETPFRESGPALSPDGRWLAYTSDELGDSFEIFVEPYPSDGARLRVSANGGVHPVWDPAGTDTLFYIGNDGEGRPSMLEATLDLAQDARVIDESALFQRDEIAFWAEGNSLRPFDISPLDGRFLFPTVGGDDSNLQMTVWIMLNWPAAI